MTDIIVDDPVAVVIASPEVPSLVIRTVPPASRVIVAIGGGSTQNYYRGVVNIDGGRADTLYGGQITLDGGGAADGRRYPI